MFERTAGDVGGPSLMEHMDLIKGAGVCGGYDITWRISGSLDSSCAIWRPHGRSRASLRSRTPW